MCRWKITLRLEQRRRRIRIDPRRFRPKLEKDDRAVIEAVVERVATGVDRRTPRPG
jgi:hypothetical protein